MSKSEYHFSGWATRNDLLCGDGRTIRKNAFKDNDGQTVPLIWNHDHSNPEAVLGHALLENREDGVYAYGTFNDTEAGQNAKKLVENGDVRSLSIWANKLKQIGKDVIHGTIRELSLVLAGANPGAFIDSVMAHGDDEGESLIINYDENALVLYHSEESSEEQEMKHSEDEKEKKPVEEETKKEEAKKSEETIAEIIDTMNEKQKTAMNIIVGLVLEGASSENENENEKEVKHSQGGNETMKQNVFDSDKVKSENVLSHADKAEIIGLMKTPGIGSLQSAISMYMENSDTLKHAFDQGDAETVKLLFPEPHLINPGAPEMIRDFDNSWVMKVINKIKKSPFAKIRTRKADARGADLKAKGYKTKGDEKKIMGQIKLLKRETSPQTVYIKDELHRDDIIDIDFDVVNYQWNVMNDAMYETLALAALVGDGREDTDPDKIFENNIRSIYHDDDFYCIHQDVDFEAAKAKLQGTNTNVNFGENYIYSEAMVEASLYSREKFKGTGLPTLYCAPHFVNVMLLARDLNGRRIYDSKADLAKALNVAEIVEIEQLEGQTRETDAGTKKLLGIVVNLADYTFGSAKGGQLTKFSDFDIDINKYKYLLETRLSGSLTEPYSAIALEEPVTE